MSDASVATLSVRTPEGRVVVEVRGSGPPLLLLHGLSAHRRIWDGVVPGLEGRFTLLVPDLLGRGESGAAPRARFTLADELRRLEIVLDTAVASGTVRERMGEGRRAGGDRGPMLVGGHSQGAALACALAARAEAVRGLLLASPVTPWTVRPRVLTLLRVRLIRRVAAGIFTPLRRPVARAVLRRVYGSGRPVTRDDVDRYALPYRERRRAETLLAALADWRPGELAGHLPRRALVVRVLLGEEDPRIGPREAVRLARHLGTRLERLPGVGHAVPEEAPERVCRAILALQRGARRATER